MLMMPRSRQAPQVGGSRQTSQFGSSRQSSQKHLGASSRQSSRQFGGSRQSSISSRTNASRNSYLRRKRMPPGRKLAKMGHSQSAPALNVKNAPMLPGEGLPSGGSEVWVRETIPGVDGRGFVDNRNFPVCPISGAPLVSPEKRRELRNTMTLNGELKTSWAFTGIQTRGYGTCYPGAPSSSIVGRAGTPPEPPAKILPKQGKYDIISGKEIIEYAHGGVPISADFSETGMLPQVDEFRPPLRDCSILSWKRPASARLELKPELDDTNPAKHLNVVCQKSYDVSMKIGGDIPMVLEAPPEKMYAIADKVGGDRADDFVRREAERRQRRRQTASKPHVSHG